MESFVQDSGESVDIKKYLRMVCVRENNIMINAKGERGEEYQKSTPHAENNYNDKDRKKKIIKIDLLNGENGCMSRK